MRFRTTTAAMLAALAWCGAAGTALSETRRIALPGDASYVLCDQDCKRLFVTSPSRGAVLIVDPVAGRMIQEIATGKTANHMAFAPNRRLLLVLNQDEPSLSLIELGEPGREKIPDSAVRHMRFERATTATYVSVVPSPGKEQKAYVSVFDQSRLSGFIAVVDLEDATAVKRITYSSFAYNSIGCPYGNAVSPDGRFLYVNVQCVGALGRAGHDPVYVYSTRYDLPVDAISFARHPNVGSGMAVRPGGKEIWSGGGNACNLASYQRQDEARALVSGCDGSGRDPITIIDPVDNTIREQIFFGSSAFISFTPDGSLAFLPRDNGLVMIDAQMREEVGAVNLGAPATGAVAFTADGKRGFAPVIGKSEIVAFDVPAPAAPVPRLKFTRP